MKVLSADCYVAGTEVLELKILKHLRTTGVTYPGSQFITTLEDSFEHEGTNGRHLCLVFKVMGESLSTFRKWLPRKELPSPLVQKFTEQLLQAISCAHSCGVIHTGVIKRAKSFVHL